MIPVSQPTLPALTRVSAFLEKPFRSGQITNGDLVVQFEESVATLVGAKYAVATSSNTLGMVLTWKSFDFPAGSEVILPSFTFPVSAHALVWNSLKPVFVDIDPATYLLDPAAVERAVTEKTVAILGVTLWGNACDDDALAAIAAKHNLALIYDSAQGVGAKYKGSYLGCRGNAEVFSFSPTKLITTAEGGAVVTNDKSIADFVRANRNYGLTADYDSPVPGLNARMSEMHAAVGLSCFANMQQAIANRLRVVKKYRSGLQDLPGISFQTMTEGAESNGVYFGIFIDREAFGTSRDQLAEELRRREIQTRCYGSPALHDLICYRDLDVAQLPVTERAAKEVLVLPLFSHISEQQVETVIAAIGDIHQRGVRGELN